MKVWSIVTVFVLLIQAVVAAEKKPSMKQVRIYSQYTYPIDPAQLYWTADMDFSYALAATLVQWDDQKQIAAGIAKAWAKLNDRTFSFSIRPDLKWSSGESVTAAQVKKSFERAFKTYPEDLRSQINMVKEIRSPSPSQLEFELVSPSAAANLLGKLTEPQFGVVYVGGDGKIDLSKSSGPFYTTAQSADEIYLKRNQNWFSYSPDLAEEIVVRKPKADFDHQRVLLTDSWANLAQTFSLMPDDLMKKYREEGFSIWKRPLDKVYLFSASKTLAKGKLTPLLQYLDRKLDRSKVGIGLAGFKIADQLFPYGYELFDSKYSATKGPIELPEIFRKRPVQILCPGGKMTSPHIQNIKAALTAALGTEPDFQCVPLDQASSRRVKGDFDLYMGSFGLADPHVEGLMSYYFEGDTAVIQSEATDFVARLDAARKEHDVSVKLQMMRSILRDAKDKGYVLPLLHLSTVGFAKGNIDLSKIPETDESLTYSKIRFKSK